MEKSFEWKNDFYVTHISTSIQMGKFNLNGKQANLTQLQMCSLEKSSVLSLQLMLAVQVKMHSKDQTNFQTYLFNNYSHLINSLNIMQ